VIEPQEVEAYGVGDGWEGTNCIAGGDICTQPYCSECAPAHDLTGPRLSTGHVGTSGQYTLDVTDYVRQKYNSGEQYATLQVRGSEARGTCGQNNIWTRHDIAFDAETSGPYLRILL